MTVRTTPYTARERLVADLGVYAQDTWTINRLTANLGVRWDYLNNKVEAQSAGGGRWIGPRSFDELTNVPNYTDIAPRLGVAYDLFGNGKTALKATFSRYVQTSTVSTARLLNPFNTTVNNTTRPWDDVNRDGIPQESELGALANTNFGRVNIATQYDPDTIEGFGKRRNNWEVSASVTQELMSRVSVDVAYFRRAQGNFTTTDNLDVTSADFQPYCVTAPSDPRLPGGGGQEICGLYDIVPTKFGVATSNVVTFVDNFGGKQTEVFTGVDVAFNARLRSDLFFSGGVATGNTSFNNCDAYVDNPVTDFGISTVATYPATPGTGLNFAYCDYDTSWLTQAKLTGSYTLPWEIQVAGVLQNLPGQPILAQWNIVQADATPSLGRPLSGGANTSRVVPLIKPGTEVHPAPHSARSAVVEDVPHRRQPPSAGDGRRLQPDELERRGGRHLERRRAAGRDQHDVRIGVASSPERPAGALREVRRAADLLTPRGHYGRTCVAGVPAAAPVAAAAPPRSGIDAGQAKGIEGEDTSIRGALPSGNAAATRLGPSGTLSWSS